MSNCHAHGGVSVATSVFSKVHSVASIQSPRSCVQLVIAAVDDMLSNCEESGLEPRAVVRFSHSETSPGLDRPLRSQQAKSVLPYLNIGNNKACQLQQLTAHMLMLEANASS